MKTFLRVLITGVLIFSFQKDQAQNLKNRILFSRYALGDDSIFAIKADGTGLQFVTMGWGPKLSPDGHYLLFLRGSSPDFSRGNLWIRDCILQHDTTLFSNFFDHISSYGWSPSSTQIVFDYSCSQYKINPDGSDFMNFFSADCYDDNPDIRTTDSLDVFHNVNQGLFTVNYDGSGRSQIPNTQRNDLTPYWSPNGNWISFGRGAGNPLYTPRNFYKIHKDGSGLTQLTFFDSTARLTYGGDWSKDSATIIVGGTVDSVSAIWSFATDGSSAHKLIYKNQTPSAIDFVSSNLNTADVITGIYIPDHNSFDFSVDPNPVIESSMISFTMAKASNVQIEMVDLFGRKVKTILNEWKNEGIDQLKINVADLPEGNYFIQLKADGDMITRKIIVVR